MLDINDFHGGGESQDKTVLTNYGYKYFKAMLFSAQFTFLSNVSNGNNQILKSKK